MQALTDDLLGRMLELPEGDRIAVVRSLRRGLCPLGLQVRFNNSQPLECYSNMTAGLNVHLYVDESGLLELVIWHKTSEGRFNHTLSNIQPEDSIELRFLPSDLPNHTAESTIADLDRLSRPADDFRLQPGHRIALEVAFDSGDSVRIACPRHGYFELMAGDGSSESVRISAGAGKGRERWRWQLPDAFPGEAVALKVTQTESDTLFQRLN